MTLPKYFTTVTLLSKIIAGILFIILPLLGFWLGIEYQKSITPIFDEQVLLNRLKRKSVPVDETANWKTYKNEEYGFEFKYPSNWFVEDTGMWRIPTFFLEGSTPKYSYQDDLGNELLDFVTAIDKRSLQEIKEGQYPNAREIILGGKPALKDDTSNIYMIPVLIKLSNNTLLTISFRKKPDVVSNFDHILSSFRFVGEE